MTKKTAIPAKRSKAKKQIEGLMEISKALTSDLYLDDVLALIVMVTANIMDSNICSIMLLDDEKKELIIKATQTISKEYINKLPIKLGEGIAGKALSEEKPIAILDVKKHPDYKYKDIAEKEGLCSLLCLPLKVKNKTIGTLNVYTSKPHKFTDTEKKLLETIANQAAIVIENSQLIVQSEIIKNELETRKVLERAKGILMKQLTIDEEAAYKLLQKYSMQNRKSMRDIAEAIILSSNLK